MFGQRKTAILIGASIAVRLFFVAALRIDSDEPQHLHVAWGWSRGFVQYRDIFDNHFPLLHLLFAPLMRLMPESSATLLWMRLAILPVAMACGWLIYRIGTPLIGRASAAIAACLFSVLPPWLPKSVEFRNDTLWIFFWLAALALLVGRRRPAYALAGIAAALCLLASVKALPLFLAHALALSSQRQSVGGKMLARVASGAAIPLLAAAAFFHVRGALDEMLYATLLYNGSVPVWAGRRIGGALAFAAIVPALALRTPRRASAVGPVAAHLAWVAVWYPLILLCFWPILTPRDFLPLVPLAALAIGGSRVGRALPVAVFAAATLAAVVYARPWSSPDSSRASVVDAVAGLTDGDDFVFDLKGETVFRKRPVRTIYESVGRALTVNGTIPDRGPEEIVAHRCCVAVSDATFIPPRTRDFLNRHFIDRGALRVCGSVARGGAFTIAVPQVYAVIARHPSRVTIDGVPYRGPRFLTAGRHVIGGQPATGNGQLTVIWWRAARWSSAKVDASVWFGIHARRSDGSRLRADSAAPMALHPRGGTR